MLSSASANDVPLGFSGHTKIVGNLAEAASLIEGFLAAGVTIAAVVPVVALTLLAIVKLLAPIRN